MTFGCATSCRLSLWRGEGTAREVVAIDWNFNGWGDTEERPARAGDGLAKKAASIFGVPRITECRSSLKAAHWSPMGAAP